MVRRDIGRGRVYATSRGDEVVLACVGWRNAAVHEVFATLHCSLCIRVSDGMKDVRAVETVSVIAWDTKNDEIAFFWCVFFVLLILWKKLSGFILFSSDFFFFLFFPFSPSLPPPKRQNNIETKKNKNTQICHLTQPPHRPSRVYTGLLYTSQKKDIKYFINSVENGDQGRHIFSTITHHTPYVYGVYNPRRKLPRQECLYPACVICLCTHSPFTGCTGRDRQARQRARHYDVRFSWNGWLTLTQCTNDVTLSNDIFST
jgi:hypothetical protein